MKTGVDTVGSGKVGIEQRERQNKIIILLIFMYLYEVTHFYQTIRKTGLYHRSKLQ